MLSAWVPPCETRAGLTTPNNSVRLPRLRRTPGERCHPQTPHGTDQVSGFALFCTLTLPFGRIRFAFAMDRSLPIASFRPCRYQQRPCDSDCLPPGRGDACGTQAGFARHAGQTKKGFKQKCLKPLYKHGREERIRTSDPSVPNAVLYQAEPLPEPNVYVPLRLGTVKCGAPFIMVCSLCPALFALLFNFP